MLRSSAVHGYKLYASPRKKNNVVTYFTHMEGHDPESMATTFALLGNLVNIINRTNFGTDQFRGFRSVKSSFEKGRFLYLRRTAFITMCLARPRLARDVCGGLNNESTDVSNKSYEFAGKGVR